MLSASPFIFQIHPYYRIKIMRKSFFHLFLLAIIVLAGCQPKTGAPEYQLVWSDEFDYEGLPDSAKWSFDTAGNAYGWGNNELQYYTSQRPENAFVSNGVLTISALREPMDSREYTSARLITREKGDWLYGRFEISAKLPTGRGLWPAIWMMPTDSEYGGWPASGEIDIMENVGYDPDTIVGTAHTQAYNHSIGTQKSGRLSVPDCHDNFHVYALEWEPHEYRLYVDSIHYYTFENEGTGFAGWPFDKRFYLLLNVAVGGNWGGRMGVDTTAFPQHLEVDYVRVFQKPGAVKP